MLYYFFFFFSSRRRHTSLTCDWSSDVCSSDLLSAEEVPCGRLQRLRRQQRPAGGAVPLRGGEQPGRVVVPQAAAIQRVRLPVRDLRPLGQGRGVAGEIPRGAQVAGLGGEPDGVGEQVLDLIEFF